MSVVASVSASASCPPDRTTLSTRPARRARPVPRGAGLRVPAPFQGPDKGDGPGADGPRRRRARSPRRRPGRPSARRPMYMDVRGTGGSAGPHRLGPWIPPAGPSSGPRPWSSTAAWPPSWRRGATTCPTRCGPRACSPTTPGPSGRCTPPSSGPARSVATSASYQASFAGFAARGLDRDAAAEPDAAQRRAGPAGPRRSIPRRRALRRRQPPPGRGLRRSLRRVPGRRLRIPRPLRPVGRELAAGTGRGWRSLAAAGPDLLALETVPDARRGPGPGLGRRGPRRPGLALVHDRRRPHPRRPAARGGVRRRRGRRGDRGRGRELLRPGDVAAASPSPRSTPASR